MNVFHLYRQLLFLHQDILASPVPGILSQIWVVMAVSIQTFYEVLLLVIGNKIDNYSGIIAQIKMVYEDKLDLQFDLTIFRC